MSNKVKNLIMAVKAGESNDKLIHRGLINVLSKSASKGKLNTQMLQEFLNWVVEAYDTYAMAKQTSHRINALDTWLKTVAMVKITSRGNVKVMPSQKYLKAWLDACKATPWYVTARGMQKATIPTAAQLETMIAKMMLAGEFGDDDLQKVLIDARLN